MSRQSQKFHVYATVTTAEQALVREKARARGLSLSNYVRECINGALLEEGHDGLLLETTKNHAPKKSVVSPA